MLSSALRRFSFGCPADRLPSFLVLVRSYFSLRVPPFLLSISSFLAAICFPFSTMLSPHSWRELALRGYSTGSGSGRRERRTPARHRRFPPTPQRKRAMAASGSGGEPGGRPWTAASTWAPPGGAAVEDAVSFETSDYDAEASPSAVVLVRPPSDGVGDPPPCQVTVNFTGKYEIHRVYVRSTARIYEIYYSTDPKDTSKDYLCTVRCGLAAKEPLHSGVESMAQWSSNAATSEKHEHETKSVTSSSDEDSWVEVKIPEFPVENNISESQERNAIGTCQKNTLAHYEATAEITDASPCVSLTIRLLSLQSKTSVHIEEIYIFADPVESTNDDSVAGPGNMGGSSLLAMLVPGLMQMSKSRNWKIDDRYLSDGSSTQLPEGCAMKESSPCEKIAHKAGPYGTNDSKFKSVGMESRLPPTDGGTVSNEKSNQDEFSLKDPKSPPLPVQTTENTQVPLATDQRVSNTDQLPNPLMNENFTPCNRIERMLDTLLSKVEKMELYCSRFEDNMMRPLGSIEARLQRLEHQFDSFSAEIQSLRDSSARMSAPDGLSDMTNSQDKGPNDGNAGISAFITSRQPGLVVRAPEFSLEDSCGYDVADENPVTLHGPNMVPRLLVKAPDFICEPELTCEKLHGGPFSPVDFALSSDKECKTSPGLVVKVPEFPNDEDDEVEEDKDTEAGDHDDGHTHTKSDDTLSKSSINSSKGKTPVSIDGALASALEAFLTSTKGTSPPRSVACTASNSSSGNTNDSPRCSVSPEQVDEISTKEGSIGQFHSTCGDADKVGTSISYEEVDEAPHTSVSKVNLVGKVDVDEQNIVLNSDKMAFVASTEPLGVPSQPRTGSIDDGTQVNGQNIGLIPDTMPFVESTEPLNAPSQPPTVLKSVDDGAQVKEKALADLESVGDTTQVNENKPTLSLAEFLAARSVSSCRNGTSEVCRGNDVAGRLSFERTSAGAGKNLEGGDSKASQKNDISQLLLLKKAFEVDEDDSKVFYNISTDPTFEASNYAAPANGDNGHGTNAMDTVSNEGRGLENTENSIRLSGGMDSLFCQLSVHDSKKRWIENSSFDSSLNDSFTKPKMEHSWSDFISMESFGEAPAREAVSSGSTTTGNSVEDLFAGIGVSSTVTPLAGEELQKVYGMLYECQDDIMGMTFVTKRTSKTSPSLEALLAESSDSEEQISDPEDTDNDAGFGSAQLFSTFSSSDDDDAYATDEPLADLVGLPIPDLVGLRMPPEAYDYATNEPLVDVGDVTNPSGTYAPAVNEPLADVVDLPNPSETHASAVNEPLASVDDLPKPSETFAGGSSGEHPDSLI